MSRLSRESKYHKPHEERKTNKSLYFVIMVPCEVFICTAGFYYALTAQQCMSVHLLRFIQHLGNEKKGAQSGTLQIKYTLQIASKDIPHYPQNY